MQMMQTAFRIKERYGSLGPGTYDSIAADLAVNAGAQVLRAPVRAKAFDPNADMTRIFRFDDGSAITEHMGQSGNVYFQHLDDQKASAMLSEMIQQAKLSLTDPLARLFKGRRLREFLDVAEKPFEKPLVARLKI